MSNITKPILLDETGIKIVDSLNSIAAILSATGTYDISNWNKIKSLIKLGIAEKVIPVGSQIIVNWTDKATSTAYSVPLDVVHYGTVTLKDGETANGMFLQWHYATPFGVQFDNYEAFYYATAVLPAGTYNVITGSSWGTNVVSGKTYQFTLTQDLPVGGQLSGFEGAPDVAPANWKVKAWSSSAATTATEIVSVTEGNLGTNLGTLKAGGDGTLNCLQRAGYGYNRWSASAIRQWLNSAGAVNAWWTPQHNWDRYPNELLTKQGFLSGFDDDFLAALTAVKVTTALNTVSDAAIGTTEDTYDKIFLPSLQQEYITLQLADVEGESWEYWKRASGLTSPAPWSTNLSQYITHGIDNKILAQIVRLRSAYRGNSSNAWNVYSSGYVTNYNSIYANRCAPACVIC
jgi:hypothetical protein